MSASRISKHMPICDGNQHDKMENAGMNLISPENRDTERSWSHRCLASTDGRGSSFQNEGISSTGDQFQALSIREIAMMGSTNILEET